MSKSPKATGSDLIIDGGVPLLVTVPDALTLHTGETGVNGQSIPFDAEIVGIRANLTEAPGTDPATIDIGIVGDGDKFVDGYSFATTDPTGMYVLYGGTTKDASVGTDLIVKAGQIITFTTGGEATTTGLVWPALLLRPLS